MPWLHRTFPALLLLASACRALPAQPPPQETRAPPEIPPAPTGPRPAWVDLAAFVENGSDGTLAYGVGRAELTTDAHCWELGKIFHAAETEGQRALASIIGSPTPATTTDRGWFDGERTVFVLIRTLAPTAATKPGAPEHSPSGGIHPRALTEAVQTRNRVILEVGGQCDDAQERAKLPCCGDLSTFCSDPRRFDRPGAKGGTCACGDGKPCLHDFQCLDHGKKKQCVCSGPRCPCDVLNCTPGEVCGDGRCY